MDEDNDGEIEWVANDRVGKSFIVMSSSGDLPSNPMYLGECLVCGGVFTKDEAMAHLEVGCLPSPEQPYAIVPCRGQTPTHRGTALSRQCFQMAHPD